MAEQLPKNLSFLIRFGYVSRRRIRYELPVLHQFIGTVRKITALRGQVAGVNWRDKYGY